MDGRGGNPLERIFREAFGDEEGRDPFSASSAWSSSANYQVHRDDQQVAVDIDVPGVAAQDIKVDVIHNPSCVVQWSGHRQQGERQAQFANRIRLGPLADCDQLAANLSRGVLRLTAPLKQQENTAIRSIPISED